MTDATQGDTVDSTGPAEVPSTIIRVPVVKAKGEFVEVDTATIPDHVYQAALAIGLKTLVNGGTSKITKASYPKADELAVAAKAKADERAKAIADGSIKLPGVKASSSKLSGAVKTEAMRLARNVVKDTLKAQKIKISHVKASQITEVAKAYLETAQGAALIVQAEANLKARESIDVSAVLDIKALVKEDPGLVAKDEARRAKEAAGKPLSAKQAGMTKKSKPGAGARA